MENTGMKITQNGMRGAAGELLHLLLTPVSGDTRHVEPAPASFFGRRIGSLEVGLSARHDRSSRRGSRNMEPARDNLAKPKTAVRPPAEFERHAVPESSMPATRPRRAPRALR